MVQSELLAIDHVFTSMIPVYASKGYLSYFALDSFRFWIIDVYCTVEPCLVDS